MSVSPGRVLLLSGENNIKNVQQKLKCLLLCTSFRCRAEGPWLCQCCCAQPSRSQRCIYTAASSKTRCQGDPRRRGTETQKRSQEKTLCPPDTPSLHPSFLLSFILLPVRSDSNRNSSEASVAPGSVKKQTSGVCTAPEDGDF